MLKRYGSTALKLIVTFVGLGLVLSRIAWRDVWANILGANPVWLLAAFSLMIMSLVVRAFRWRVLLRGLGETSISFGRLITLYFIGTFFNAFLPSGMGGDVVRAYEATRDVSAETAAGTVIVDRMCGLLMLFAMALAMLPFRPDNFPENWFWVILAVAITGLVGGFLLLEGTLFRLIIAVVESKVGENSLLYKIIKPFKAVLAAVHGCGWGAVGRALLVSLVFNLMLTSWWFFVTQALNLDVSWSYCLLVAPIMSISLLIPSIGGLGVREALAPSLFIAAGVPEASAVALSLLVTVMLRTVSLLGGPVYLLSSLKNKST